MTGKIIPEKDVIRRAGIDSNGNEKQHIYVCNDEELDVNTFFSVTTALNHWDDPEKDKAIKGWKEKNDGTEGTENWEDILRYAQLRGTLCHAEAQEKYADDKIWGSEEDLAEEELKNFGEFEGEDAYEKYQNDRDWFVDEIHNMLDDEIDEVLYTEAYCFNDDPAYAGQVDLVYRDREGEIVVCDLKTSKQVGYSYLLQSNAYAQVIEDELGEPVSKLQIARANPNYENSELYTIQRDRGAIEVTDIIKREYGYRVVLDTLYQCKNDIQDLNWDLHHQTWDDDLEHWTVAVRNKNNSVLVDLALSTLADSGWTVAIQDGIKQRLVHQCGVPEDTLNFNKIDSPYTNLAEQLSVEFEDLVEIENENKPIRFVEDVLTDHETEFDTQIVEYTQQVINDHKGDLGDKHPHEILSALLRIAGAETTTIESIFNPENLEQNTKLYEKELSLENYPKTRITSSISNPAAVSPITTDSTISD